MVRRALISSLVAGVLAACNGGSPASPSPTGTPVPVATAQPTPTPVVEPNPRVTLDVAGDWDVTAVVTDHSGDLVSVESGTGRETMTVRWFDAQVESLSASTIGVTWVGLPRDEEIAVVLSRNAGKLVIEINQAAPPINSDAEGLDRVLVLAFDGPVAADDVEVRFEGVAS